MKIIILGAGSLGSALGGVLAAQGHEIWLITRNAAHVRAVREKGLVLRSKHSEQTVQLKASTDAHDAGIADGVIVLVKSGQTQQAALSALPCVGTQTWAMSLQNGMGHEDVLAKVFGKEKILAGKTYCGGQLLEPGAVMCGVQGKDTHIGELAWNQGGAISERLLQIAELFNLAGIETHPSANIEGTMWDKLFINVATGALSGITRLPYGHLYAVPQLPPVAELAVAEAMSIARARGVHFQLHNPLQAWQKAGAGLPFEFKASILQTLEKNMRTEIDFINGYVVSEGARLGIPTPVNSTLVACIKGIEHLLPQ